MTPQAPKRMLRFLRWFCREDYLEEFEGDLVELFEEQYAQSPRRASWQFTWGVLRHFRPMFIKSFNLHFINKAMIRHNFKISYRGLLKNKGFSAINIGGLAMGMAVFILIALWLRNELTYNQYHKNKDRIARVMQHRTIGDQKQTWFSSMLPLADELRDKYGSDFDRVVRSSFQRERIFYFNDEGYTRKGYYMQPEGPAMLSLQMKEGALDALVDPTSVLISASFADALFRGVNPLGRVLKISRKYDLKIAGVYEDMPSNSSFANVDFICTWQQYLTENQWIENMNNPWGSSSFLTLVQLSPTADVHQISAKIKDAIFENVSHDQDALNSKPECFLHPMNKWKLYSRFENGKNTGGYIETVRLFGFIAAFVLLLACINFVNLSTARSEKRAKEVGVRKAIGSMRNQLIGQFYSETILVAAFAMALSLVIVYFSLPWFNEIANKQIQINWTNPWLYLMASGFILLIGLLAGSYPALYLSSFKPVKVLKGTFRAGRFATLPRKVLVVIQFTISTALIIGTIIVYQQIQHGLNRPLGYDQSNLVTVYAKLADVNKHFKLIKEELKQNRVVEEIAKSSSPVTAVYGTMGSWNWRGKDPNLGVDFPYNLVTAGYGKTVGWQFVKGRDFLEEMVSDSNAIIMNEAAAKLMGFENPIDEIIDMDGEDVVVVGVVKDMIIESPFAPIRPIVYRMYDDYGSILNLKLNPDRPVNELLSQVEKAVKQHDPNAILEFDFADESFGEKFFAQEQVRRLATVFAFLALIISCLGLFGLTAYMAERRSKEIGIRKVLGASIGNLWQLLSKDFLLLVVGSFLLAIPMAYYFLQDWLNKYDYRIEISWWVFGIACFLVLGISLLTISYQTVRTALANPVTAIKEE